MPKKDTKVCLAIVWHQHQPYYWELASNELSMPWVRLHAVKDYYDMAARLERFPEVHQTFNLVPSLLQQIEAYGDGTITDKYLEHSKIPVASLNRDQKRFLVERFFDMVEGTMVAPHRRFQELKQVREGLGVNRTVSVYDVQDFLDLQVWFNLAWIDPTTRAENDFLRGLQEKGSRFTEEEKGRLLEEHTRIVNGVIPIHRSLQEKGILEATTTPFFHPILPLLCDTNEARVAVPDMKLPSHRFRHPEDAREQVRRAKEYYEARFGRAPRGMWPAEGSVSPEAAALFVEQGVEWIATDEEVLSHSLGVAIHRDGDGNLENPEILYRPYKYETSEGPIRILFRDHLLSDQIGFQYQGADPRDAANDFIGRIERVIKRSPSGRKAPLALPVILDGENCWEFYPNDGNDFLDQLYERLSEHREIRCVTVSEYLDEYGDQEGAVGELPKLHSGSWINHNFRIWIGHVEDNQAWDCLYDAREALVAAEEAGGVSEENLKKAWDELYIAEGSDWNWWYGDDHHSDFGETFDDLYRKHLQNIYAFIGKEVPARLYVPIAREVEVTLVQQPRRFISPTIDGRIGAFYEWNGAGRFDAVGAGGAMHRTDSRIHTLCFGFDLEMFYLRVDFASPSDRLRPGESCRVVFPGSERSVRATLKANPDGGECLLEHHDEKGWTENDLRAVGGVGTIVEIGVPWEALSHVEPGQSVSFVVTLLSGDTEMERAPQRATIATTRPTEDYEDQMWFV